MNWFKSLWLSSEERKILKEAKKLKEELDKAAKELKTEEIDISNKPFKKLIYTNNTLVIVLKSNSVITRPDCSKEFFEEVKSCTSESELVQMMLLNSTDNNSFNTDKELLNLNLNCFIKNSDFTVVNEKVFLKGVNLELPPSVCFSFIEILEKMGSEKYKDKIDELLDLYQALKMFWLQLALNPIEQSREDLLTFVKNNDIRITRNGNLVLYRRIINLKGKNDELVSFVSQMYYNRKKQKKAELHPRNYSVIKGDKCYELVKKDLVTNEMEVLGNLDDMYKNLDKLEDNVFTSHYNKGKHTIKIGSVYKIDDSEINLDNNICAAGGLKCVASF